VALSRARLGLYVLGRREVFESCYELRQAFELLLQRPDKLALVTGELWPSERVLAEEVGKEVAGEAIMEGVEHLGQYVFEMTGTKVKQQQAGQGSEAAGLVENVQTVEGDDDDVGIIEADQASDASGADVGGPEAEED